MQNLSFSIADLPFGISLHDNFALAKELGVGVEVVLGYKTRLSLRNLDKLSRKYNVPIVSVHQPPWSFFQLFKDEKSFTFASHFGAYYNAHPLITTDVEHDQSKRYFEWLSQMAEKYQVEVLIENMPFKPGLVPFLPNMKKVHFSTTSMKQLADICAQYKFGFTLDTDHLKSPEPQKEEGFENIKKYMKNIHISSFDEKREHLPLTKGRLNTRSFLEELKKNNYQELITLEMTPNYYYPKKDYMKDIKDSILLMREI